MPKSVDLGANLAPKMEPKWSQDGAKIDEKSIFKQEAGKTTQISKNGLISEGLDQQKPIKTYWFFKVFVKSAFEQKVGLRAPKIIKNGAKMEPKWKPHARKIDLNSERKINNKIVEKASQKASNMEAFWLLKFS